ncbi:hypothetical protein [Sulfidibacter corallicola]|uniref:Uncharacterized protein n=1 Tax=Sulfidibacter corallicola TaxID=2818388 RepID=A0A8A4TTV9_SULCO|nr:hypothetical protein [Sulfidibacter corallicola]QTD52913.1 hypothetical protein J3U87_10585 [Sulfidibacter corallicola]
MICKEKHQSAIRAIHRLLIKARSKAYQKDHHDSIAKLLDDIEYLPSLMLAPSDESERFQSYLKNISETHNCPGIFEEFDTGD